MTRMMSSLMTSQVTGEILQFSFANGKVGRKGVKFSIDMGLWLALLCARLAKQLICPGEP